MQIAFALTVVSHCQAPVIEDADAIYDITSNSLVCAANREQLAAFESIYNIICIYIYFFLHASLYLSHICNTFIIFPITESCQRVSLSCSSLPANQACHLNIFEVCKHFPEICISHAYLIYAYTHTYMHMYIRIPTRRIRKATPRAAPSALIKVRIAPCAPRVELPRAARRVEVRGAPGRSESAIRRL